MEGTDHVRPVNAARTQNARPTIGLFTVDVFHPNEELLWLGVVDAARQFDVNLICCAGGFIQHPDRVVAQANVLYDLATPYALDGLLIWSGTIGNFINQAALAAFFRRYQTLPCISIEEVVAGSPSVLKNSYQGMRTAMLHLLDVHGYRRIAFLQGNEGAAWAQERYQAYLDVLAEYHLPRNPDLIVPLPTMWDSSGLPRGGDEQMRVLLDERKLRPTADVEAVVCATDNLARQALAALQARGIKTPQEVAVVGFDDEPESNVITPPLTTVRNPAYDLGWKALEVLLTHLRGEDTPEQVVVPATLVVRQSCGCPSAIVEQAVVKATPGLFPASGTAPPFETALAEHRAEALTAMAQALEGAKSPCREQAGQVWDAFAAEVRETSPGAWLATLKDVLQQAAAADDNVAAWQNALSELRRYARPCLGTPEAVLHAENLWSQARILISEIAQRAQAYQTLQAEQQAQMLRKIEADLLTTFNVPGLMDVLANGLPRLQMRGCTLALYENPQSPTEWSLLMLAYDEAGRRAFAAAGQRFPSTRLIPEGMFREDRSHPLVLEPLSFQEAQIGVILFEMGPRNGKIYETLRGQISSALQGALLVQQVQERTAEVTRQKYILDTFMANVPDSIYFKDRDSRFIHGNQALARRFSVNEPAALIGKTDFDFFPETQARPKYEQEQAILRTGQPVLAVEEPDAGGAWALTTKMPLRDEHGGIIGVFGISRDITALKQAQFEVAAAYEEIRLLNQQLQAENLRMRAELDVSRRIQQMVLPSAEELRQIDGLEIVGFMQPADEVGGDYYDVLKRNGGLHIGIGDVTGHGLESGVLMLMTQTAIRTLVEHGETDPVAFLSTLNRVLLKNAQRMHADKTLTLAFVNYHDKCLKLIGQHEELLVVRQGGRVERVDTLKLGFPLGMVDEIAQWVAETTIVLQPGDSVVLYTDGITEAENKEQTLYGIERLCAVVGQFWDKSAEEMKQAVIDDVTRHLGGHKVYDDLTLVVLKQQ